MKKQMWLGVMVLVLLATTVMPVMAEGGKNQIRWLGQVFSLVGEVTALDGETKTITVEVYSGSKLVKSYIGKELTFTTDGNTQFLLYGHSKGDKITFAGVEVGDNISVSGNIVYDVFLAKRVTVDVPLNCQGCQK